MFFEFIFVNIDLDSRSCTHCLNQKWTSADISHIKNYPEYTFGYILVLETHLP